jgi:hypothetical protein
MRVVGLGSVYSVYSVVLPSAHDALGFQDGGVGMGQPRKTQNTRKDEVMEFHGGGWGFWGLGSVYSVYSVVLPSAYDAFDLHERVMA